MEDNLWAFQCAASSESNPIIHEVWMWWDLHQRDGVEDVTNVVAEVKDRVGDDGLGGGNASRQQRQRRGQRQRRLQLFDCKLLQSETRRCLASAGESLLNPVESFGDVYLLTLLEQEQKLHADRGDPSALGPVKAAVGQKDSEQGLVLPQPRLAPLKMLLLGLKAPALQLVSLVGANI